MNIEQSQAYYGKPVMIWRRISAFSEDKYALPVSSGPMLNDTYDLVFSFQPSACLTRGFAHLANQHVTLRKADFTTVNASQKIGIEHRYRFGRAVAVRELPLASMLERKRDNREHLCVVRFECAVHGHRRSDEKMSLSFSYLGRFFLCWSKLNLFDALIRQRVSNRSFKGSSDIWIAPQTKHEFWDFDRNSIDPNGYEAGLAAVDFARDLSLRPQYKSHEPRATEQYLNNGTSCADVRPCKDVGSDLPVLNSYSKPDIERSFLDRLYLNLNRCLVTERQPPSGLRHLTDSQQRRRELRDVHLAIADCLAVIDQTENGTRHFHLHWHHFPPRNRSSCSTKVKLPKARLPQYAVSRDERLQ